MPIHQRRGGDQQRESIENKNKNHENVFKIDCIEVLRGPKWWEKET